MEIYEYIKIGAVITAAYGIPGIFIWLTIGWVQGPNRS